MPAKQTSIPKTANRTGTSQSIETGVSVILCTNRPKFLPNIFLNYGRQLYNKKELIIVLNNNRMDLNIYQFVAGLYPSVSVYHMHESTSLGKCLNFAVSKSNYPIVAKFDDDDYYSPYYLNGVVQCFQKNKVDVIGKNTCYLYLTSKNLLLLFHPDKENQYTDMVMGSTLACRRSVFQKVKFRNVSIGEDTYFFEDCAKRKIKIYSCDRFNYVCFRRKNRLSHTWSIDERTLLEHSNRVAKTKNFTRIITRAVSVSSKKTNSSMRRVSPPS